MANLEPEELKKRLTKALRMGGNTHTPVDLADAIKEGRMQAWQNGQSVVVTEVLGFPQKNVLNVFLAVGSLDEIMALQPKIEEFGRLHKCSHLMMHGRKGWEKVLPKYGWAHARVNLERPL